MRFFLTRSSISIFAATILFTLISSPLSAAVTIDDDYIIDADTSDDFILESGWKVRSFGNFTASGAVTTNARGEYVIPSGASLTLSQRYDDAYGFTKTGSGALKFTGGNSSDWNSNYWGITSGQHAAINLREGTMDFAGSLCLGHVGGSSATLTVHNGADLTVGTYTFIGNSGVGTLNVTGGTLAALNSVYLANGSGGTGFLNISDGIVNSSTVLAGVRGMGKIHLSGGELNVGSTLNISFGHNGAASEGIVYQTGGTLNALNNGIYFGGGGNGSTKGAYYLADGTLNVSTIDKQAGLAATFEMTGGTLNAQDIKVNITQFGGTLSPGGDGVLGTTTFFSDYLITPNPEPGVSRVNLAYRGVASHSSGYNGDEYPASRAFDGDLGNFSHTSGTEDQWLKVNLGDDYTVAKVAVYYRGGYYHRIVGNGSKYFFRLADETETTFWDSDHYDTYTTSPTYYLLDTTKTENTRFLSFVRDFAGGLPGGDDRTINMSEMQVFAAEEIFPNVLHLDIDLSEKEAGRQWIDQLAFEGAARLILEGDVFLELEFIGTGMAGMYEIFTPAVLSHIDGYFTDVVFKTPGWKVDSSSLMEDGCVKIAGTPEPATWGMLLMGAAGLGFLFRRRIS